LNFEKAKEATQWTRKSRMWAKLYLMSWGFIPLKLDVFYSHN